MLDPHPTERFDWKLWLIVLAFLAIAAFNLWSGWGTRGLIDY